jgi:hypothetical protein
MSVNNDNSHIPIKKSEFEQHKVRFNRKLETVTFEPAKKTAASKAVESTQLRTAASVNPTRKDTVKIIDAIKKITDDSQLLNPVAVSVLDAIRTGFSISMRVFELYANASGLTNLIQQQKANRLLEQQKPEFISKNTTSSFITLFVAASYIRWKLNGFENEQSSKIELPDIHIPEIRLAGAYGAVDCLFYYYGVTLERSQMVRTEYELVKFTVNFFEKVIDELRNRLPSMENTNFFTDVSYKLEESEFIIDGFETQSGIVEVVQEFNRVEFDEIVGNREAKHAAQRLAMRLACYDPVSRRNPWKDLGGLTAIRMGYGKPGTGKSLQIAATATKIQDLCERREVAFKAAPISIDRDENGELRFSFWPMPDNIVSTFQGGSAEAMVKWMKRFQDPDGITYGPIDDGENNLEERTRQGVSSGVREVVGVFLRYTEGAYAINHGNWAIDIMTNIPEQVDKAVLSRIQSRFPIDGARAIHDFADQDYLWWRKIQETNPSFIDVNGLDDYEFLSLQADLSSLSDVEAGDVIITDERLRKTVEDLRKIYELEDAAFFAKLYAETQKLFGGFTSRDIRNIQKAVTNRIMDFDIPESWFDIHEEFFGKPYEERLEILRSLMRENTKGLSFNQVRYREALKYINNVATIEGAEDDRAIMEMLKKAELRKRAREKGKEKGMDPQLVY